MSFAFPKCLGLVAFALLLSAGASQQMAQAQTPAWQAITPTKLVIKRDSWPAPMEANEALSNGANLEDALRDFHEFTTPPANLGARISGIKAAHSDSGKQTPGTTGFGGAIGLAFLDAAEDALQAGNFDPDHQVHISLWGKIEDYSFTEIGTTGTGNGSLTVVTHITWTRMPHKSAASPKAIQTKTDTYRWQIEVNNGGFRIVEKGDQNNPFAGTLEFTSEMKARIDDLGFKFKLWAKGTDIEIKNVEKRNPAGNFVPIPNNPANAKLYASDAANCIDMLFVDRPPASLDGMQPPLYCLGRCESPLIINTGI